MITSYSWTDKTFVIKPIFSLFTGWILVFIIQTIFLGFLTLINDPSRAWVKVRVNTEAAYQSIQNGDLNKLKKHPLWDLDSPNRNPASFKRLQ